MRKVHVFLASSAELRQERSQFSDLLKDITDDIFTTRGIRLIPELWEFEESSILPQRKEDLYIEQLKKSEICIALFWNNIGRYTKEELDYAVERMKNGQLPYYVHAYFREPAEIKTKDFSLFKEHFEERYSTVPKNSYTDIDDLRSQIAELFKQIL